MIFGNSDYLQKTGNPDSSLLNKKIIKTIFSNDHNDIYEAVKILYE